MLGHPPRVCKLYRVYVRSMWGVMLNYIGIIYPRVKTNYVVVMLEYTNKGNVARTFTYNQSLLYLARLEPNPGHITVICIEHALT